MPIVIVQLSHESLLGECGSITRLLDRHFSEKIDRRHDVREVHGRDRRTRNRRTEIVFRLLRRINPVRNAPRIEQHVRRLMADAAHRSM
jgi:hypothetical protein